MKRNVNPYGFQGNRKSKTPRLDVAGLSQGPLNEEGDQTNYLCASCKKIDFASIIKTAKSGRRRVRRLRHIHFESKCSLCGFLRRVQPPKYQVNSLNLVVVSAKSLFTIPKSVQVNDCTLLSVGVNTSRDYHELKFFGIPQTGPQQLSVREISEYLPWELPVEWLDFCGTHHKTPCNGYTGPGIANLRVINCRTREILPLPSSSTPYVTLSYLWGNNQDDDQRNYDRLPLRAPDTIEDAILVTLRLRYKYLWVDRFCIRQTHAPEKDGLIRDMGQIYKNSALTIIAVSGECPAYGLPGVSRPRILQDSFKVGETLLLSIPDAKKEINSSKWNTRGWTYQEGLLSRRRLVFTDQQIYFQCANMHCFEAFAVPLADLHILSSTRFPENINLSKAFPTRGAGKWPCEIFKRIQEYRKRHLSFEDDTLRAFLGIISEFESSIYHLHGLPILPPAAYGAQRWARDPTNMASASIIHALLWDGDRRMRRRQSCPSWSWVGWRSSDDETARYSHWSPYGTRIRMTSRKRGYVCSAGDITPIPMVDIFVEQREPNGDIIKFLVSNSFDVVVEATKSLPWPTHLHLSGWTFDISVTWTSKPINGIVDNKLTSCLDELGAKKGYTFLPMNDRQIGREYKFICTFMTHTPMPKDSRPYGRSYVENEFDTLVLEEKGNATFERVGIIRFKLGESQTLFSSDCTSVSLAGIERREICLG